MHEKRFRQEEANVKIYIKSLELPTSSRNDSKVTKNYKLILNYN